MNREPVTIEPRKTLSRKEYLHLMLEQEGRCGCGCGVKLDPMKEGVRDEHRIPLAQGGSNALSNRELWRQPCSAKKDKVDAKNTAKCKRIADREAGKKNPTTLHGRGFGDQHRPLSHPTLKRTFGGRVVAREEAR